MNRPLASAFAVCLLYGSSLAIGLQHITIRSQSTQGPQWFGTSSIVQEKFWITVNPNYLDVELEWVLDVGGYSKPDTFTNALEIVGNLNIEAGSVVTGMLLWNGDQILKAKLKPVGVAREQYEQVVDRDANAPPPPRDPVIFEYGWGPDNYYMSVFPACWQGTRRMRIRYVIPSHQESGVTKIGYPHASSQNAQVTLYKGHGIGSFLLQDRSGATEEITADSVVLPSARASSYNSGTVMHILPTPPAQVQGSRLYVGTFSTPSLQGQMIHFVGMTPQQILDSSSMREEYVILWRWNHAEVLSRYGLQIVQQSDVLQQFLTALQARNKKVALVIDRQGGEQTAFRLSGMGSDEYKRMLRYLADLSAMKYVSAPADAGPALTQTQINQLVDASLREFNDAIQAAMAQFSDRSEVLRHLIVLTAGPRWFTQYPRLSDVTCDPSIEITGLAAQVARHSKLSGSTYVETPYWPGVDLNGVFARHTHSIAASAVLTNGVVACSTGAASAAPSTWYYSGFQAAPNELRIYSPTPLKPAVRWTVSVNGAPLLSFRERPSVVTIDDGMQYSRLVGAFPNLIYLDTPRPTTLAPILGFVDQKYALLALEGDVLDDSTSWYYRVRGVPGLGPDDIFPAPQDSIGSADNSSQAASVVNTPVDHARLVPGVRVSHAGKGVVIFLDWAQLRNDKNLSIAVFSAAGRVLKQWDYRDLCGKSRISWSPDNGAGGRSVVIVRVRTLRGYSNTVVTLR